MTDWILPRVIFEDEHLLVINKPYGMVVNRADSVKTSTLQDWVEVRKHWLKLMESRSEENDFFKRSGIVHRIDKDTSGIVIIAKTKESFDKLVIQFFERKVRKTYVALVHGKLEPKNGTIALPIARDKSKRERFIVIGKGRYAETRWEVVKYYSGLRIKKLKGKYPNGFSLLNVYPKTGRTHQIRVHLAHLNHPLAGDRRYSSGKQAKLDSIWCPRHFLHAERIRFIHPKTDFECEFKAPLAVDLRAVLALLHS